MNRRENALYPFDSCSIADTKPTGSVRKHLAVVDAVGSDWALALAQQQDLTVSSGDAHILAAKVRRGADLHLYVTTESYEETICFQQTIGGPGDAFAGILNHHHSFTENDVESDTPSVSVLRYDTGGTYGHVKCFSDNSCVEVDRQAPYQVYQWRINDRWRKVYENDDQGRWVSGDLEELKRSVRRGETVRLGVRDLFGLVEDERPSAPAISFGTTMQTLIRNGHIQAASDVMAIGKPIWPIRWAHGLHIARMRASTSGELVCFVASPDEMRFRRILRRRPMVWMVAGRR